MTLTSILVFALCTLLNGQVCLGQSSSLTVSSLEARQESLEELCERAGGACVNTRFPTSVTDATDHPCRYLFYYDWIYHGSPLCTNSGASGGHCKTCSGRNFDFNTRTGANLRVIIDDFRARIDPEKLDTLMKMDSSDCLDRSSTGKWGVLTANALVELYCAKVTRVENACPLTDDGAACGKCKQGTCVVPITEGVCRVGEECEASPCEAAAEECKFKFEGSDDAVPTFDLSSTAPNRPFTSRIVHKDPSIVIGIANSNNLEPEFIGEGKDKVIGVSEAGSGSVQRLSRNFFKPFTTGTGSGVGHETVQRGQESLISGKCVRMFLTDWQVLDPDTGNVMDNANNQMDKEQGYCVVFRTA